MCCEMKEWVTKMLFVAPPPHRITRPPQREEFIFCLSRSESTVFGRPKRPQLFIGSLAPRIEAGEVVLWARPMKRTDGFRFPFTFRAFLYECEDGAPRNAEKTVQSPTLSNLSVLSMIRNAADSDPRRFRRLLARHALPHRRCVVRSLCSDARRRGSLFWRLRG